MAFTAELEKVQTTNAQKIAEEHNAMIKERYRRLQDAEAEQFATPSQSRYEQETPRASVFAPEAPAFVNAPAVEQTPQVTEFVSARAETPVFTMEKFNNMQAEAAIPTMTPAPVAPMNVEVYTPTQAAVESEGQFALSPFAKKILLAFAATTTVLLSIIGINTGIIKRNNIRLKNLKEQEETLVSENEDLQQRIEAATSEETIIQYALEQGMIRG
ncbi:MAG: hypothetical protein E7355_05635 [Clostridiales bacterium]|nr:hypothetical protein [Clostridiales bacterium]